MLAIDSFDIEATCRPSRCQKVTYTGWFRLGKGIQVGSQGECRLSSQLRVKNQECLLCAQRGGHGLFV